MVLHLQLDSWSTQINALHGPTLTITFMVNMDNCTYGPTVFHRPSWSTQINAHHGPTVNSLDMEQTPAYMSGRSDTESGES